MHCWESIKKSTYTNRWHGNSVYAKLAPIQLHKTNRISFCEVTQQGLNKAWVSQLETQAKRLDEWTKKKNHSLSRGVFRWYTYLQQQLLLLMTHILILQNLTTIKNLMEGWKYTVFYCRLLRLQHTGFWSIAYAIKGIGRWVDETACQQHTLFKREHSRTENREVIITAKTTVLWRACIASC